MTLGLWRAGEASFKNHSKMQNTDREEALMRNSNSKVTMRQDQSWRAQGSNAQPTACRYGYACAHPRHTRAHHKLRAAGPGAHHAGPHLAPHVHHVRRLQGDAEGRAQLHGLGASKFVCL